MIKRIFAVLQLALLVILTGNHLSLLYGNEESISVDVLTSDLMCGINGAYIGINSLNPKSVAYSTIVTALKDGTKRGVSLKEIQDFVASNTRLETEILFCSEQDIRNMKEYVVALVLLEGEPISHIVVKRSRPTGIQIMDSTNRLCEIKQNDFEGQKRATLLISTESITANLLYKSLNVLAYVVFFMAIVYLIILLKRNRMEKQNEEQKTNTDS